MKLSELETRYCKNPNCDNPIPKHYPTGKSKAAVDYQRQRFCCGTCRGEASHAPTDPTPQEIAEQAAAIRATWPAFRVGQYDPEPAVVPAVVGDVIRGRHACHVFTLWRAG